MAEAGGGRGETAQGGKGGEEGGGGSGRGRVGGEGGRASSQAGGVQTHADHQGCACTRSGASREMSGERGGAGSSRLARRRQAAVLLTLLHIGRAGRAEQASPMGTAGGRRKGRGMDREKAASPPGCKTRSGSNGNGRSAGEGGGREGRGGRVGQKNPRGADAMSAGWGEGGGGVRDARPACPSRG